MIGLIFFISYLANIYETEKTAKRMDSLFKNDSILVRIKQVIVWLDKI